MIINYEEYGTQKANTTQTMVKLVSSLLVFFCGHNGDLAVKMHYMVLSEKSSSKNRMS